MANKISEQQASVFRLSAIIYANNNYQISPIQLHKKVVEDALYQIDKADGVSIEYLADYIENTYLITFTENELNTVLLHPKFTDVFIRISCAGQTLFALSDGRRSRIDAHKAKTLQDFIADYLAMNKLPDDNAVAINRYLYEVFTTNVDSFSRMLEAKNVKSLTEHHSPKDEENDLINGFLDWDNDEKNVAIFNLASYALEYCMLTSKKESSVKADSLKHKIFYLDTNILYRAIGVDGNDRKQRTLSFFKKMISSDNELRISRLTWEEYEGSMKQYMKRLRKSESPAVHSKVYTEFVTYDSIFTFYRQWAGDRKNPATSTVDYFQTMLEASVKTLLEDYKIKIEQLCPFDIKEAHDVLNDMASEIKSKSLNKWFDSAYTDACNVMWVEKSRGVGEQSIFSTKTFLLSSDWGLFNWDSKQYSKKAPIVLLPSQWLSLLLRYVSRSNDDFKSFVCFLNIQPKEGVLSAEEIASILEGISEMTTDLQQQRHLLDTIIENDFKKGANGMNSGQLKSFGKKEANRLLQKKISAVEKDNRQMRETIETLKTEIQIQKGETERLSNAASEVDKLKTSMAQMQSELFKKEKANTENDTEIQSLNERLSKANGTIKRYQDIGCIILWVLWILFLAALVVWFFCSTTVSDNWMGSLLTWIESLNATQQYVARGSLLLVISVILIPSVLALIKKVRNL